MKFINFLFALALISSAIFNSACAGCNRPEPNFEGVLMQNCGKNGLSDFTVVTGSQGVLGPCSELYQVPMFEQRGDPDELGVTSNDGGYFKIDPMYTYNAIRGTGPSIILNYKHTGVSDPATMMDNIESIILNPLVLNAYREEARNFSTDSLLRNLAKFEQQVETRLKSEFKTKFFALNQLSSGLKPPESMIKAIERRNNAIQEAEQVRNELEVSRMQLEKAKIEAEANRQRTQGLSKEVLQEKWIEAIRNTQNKVIITDGKTPVIINN